MQWHAISPAGSQAAWQAVRKVSSLRYHGHLMRVEKFEKRLVDTMHWSHSEMVDYHVRTKTPGSQFFHHLSTLQLLRVVEQKQHIEDMALVKGSVLRRFAPEQQGQLLKLSDRDLEAEVNLVCKQRAEAVIQRHTEETASIAMGAGKLLYFLPGRSPGDGKAMMVSGGFFDKEGFPPSDTWMGYLVDHYEKDFQTGYLLSWVPQSVEVLVDRAIKADTTQCMQWAANVKTPFLLAVRDRMGYSI